MPGTEGIPCLLMRGGTSKGALFLASDLPADPAERDDLLLRIMGSPDPRQVDGLGGAHPLTSKVAVISPSPDAGADVDYLFLQVAVDTALVSSRQNCGNILAAVGPFAVERGLVQPADGQTEVRIRMLNTGSMATARFPTPGGVVDYDGGPAAGGAVAIDGVPGTAAAIRLNFEGTAGSSTGALFPTGHLMDRADRVDLTCVDNGMPTVLMRAADLGVAGDEAPADLEANAGLAQRLAGLRLAAADLMGMGDVSAATVPKLVLLAPPREGGAIATRSFLPVRVHTSIGVLGALTVAAGVLAEGSVGHDLGVLPSPGQPFRVEHPSGHFDVEVSIEATPDGYTVTRSTALRTARKIFEGRVFPRP
ncbi:4-oxalomesaconate tautomerase [Pseudarthrobacter sp. NIBRBAC000502771]|uniref:4-oxalomesaconate tautomerase n=1 Tax=Pseudarthrobacter sp. NIBRBAC000502771 TaxID=2590774 RepID=UPI00112FFB8B|nr:4-oxalomesaconate tautomerase [Pseudarthrobacter sp. NIBRBAC000502771]QDG61860.1 4-oxalomesaconate tautomerase [Pseudarthrobacter sp. NIBRBAC000502771]